MSKAVVCLVLVACDAPGTPRVAATKDVGVEAPTLAGDAGVDAFIDEDLASRLDLLEPAGRPRRPLVRRHRSGDCSTKYAPRPDRDPSPMCRIEGGTFQMGGAFDDRPSHIVSSRPVPTSTTVRGFDIDQFEVTAPQAALFLNAHGNECPGLHIKLGDAETRCVLIYGRNGLSERDGLRERNGKVEVIPGHEDVVVANFSVEGAMRYCAWVGKQLVTSAQWEYAARHDPRTGRDLTYPWGDAWRENHTCTTRGSCPREWRRYRSVNIAGMFDGTRGRGDGSSPFGVHDTIETAPEFVVACDDPNDTCKPGTPCTCQVMTTAFGQFQPALATTFARFSEFPHAAVRCVRPRD